MIPSKNMVKGILAFCGCFLFSIMLISVGCDGNQGCEGDACPIGSAMIVLDQSGDAFCFVEARNGGLHLVGMAQQARPQLIGNPSPIGVVPQVPIGNSPGRLPSGQKPMIQKPPSK